VNPEKNKKPDSGRTEGATLTTNCIPEHLQGKEKKAYWEISRVL